MVNNPFYEYSKTSQGLGSYTVFAPYTKNSLTRFQSNATILNHGMSQENTQCKSIFTIQMLVSIIMHYSTENTERHIFLAFLLSN